MKFRATEYPSEAPIPACPLPPASAAETATTSDLIVESLAACTVTPPADFIELVAGRASPPSSINDLVLLRIILREEAPAPLTAMLVPFPPLSAADAAKTMESITDFVAASTMRSPLVVSTVPSVR